MESHERNTGQHTLQPVNAATRRMFRGVIGAVTPRRCQTLTELSRQPSNPGENYADQSLLPARRYPRAEVSASRNEGQNSHQPMA